MNSTDFKWNLLVELRKELIESQKIRAQIIGFKITFVSAAIGLIATRPDNLPNTLLAVPAFASFFFDFLINSYSFSIKRMGFYIREYLEPELKHDLKLPQDLPLWQEFLKQPFTRQVLSLLGNLGITLIAVGAAIIALFTPFHPMISITLIALLLIFLGLDLYTFLVPRKFGKTTNAKNPESMKGITSSQFDQEAL